MYLQDLVHARHVKADTSGWVLRSQWDGRAREIGRLVQPKALTPEKCPSMLVAPLYGTMGTLYLRAMLTFATTSSVHPGFTTTEWGEVG